jgi:hypothetical protein
MSVIEPRIRDRPEGPLSTAAMLRIQRSWPLPSKMRYSRSYERRCSAAAPTISSRRTESRRCTRPSHFAGSPRYSSTGRPVIVLR